MEETIILLREQTVFCNRLLKLFADLTETIKNNSLDMSKVVGQIEPVILELSKNSTRSQMFLDKMKFKTFSEFIDAQEDGVKKDVAKRLLKQNSELQKKLQRTMQTLKILTDKGKKFVEFNLNVMSQTSSNTYGAEAQTGNQSGRRLFDANI
jgi:hypothetical protein